MWLFLKVLVTSTAQGWVPELGSFPVNFKCVWVECGIREWGESAAGCAFLTLWEKAGACA